MNFEVLVVPSTTTGALSSNLGRKIAAKAGNSIQDEAMDVAPIAIGAALITRGGDLAVNWLIHVPVSLTPGSRVGVESVRRATRAALVASYIKGYPVVAMPPMTSTPESGIPAIEIARAMLDEIRAHRHAKPETIVLVDERGDVARMANKILDSIK